MSSSASPLRNWDERERGSIHKNPLSATVNYFSFGNPNKQLFSDVDHSAQTIGLQFTR